MKIKPHSFRGIFLWAFQLTPSLKSVNGTRGISKAVTLDGVYRSINKHIIEGLQYRCDENDVFKALHYIDVGDRVKIESGPFADFICTVDQLKGDQTRGS